MFPLIQALPHEVVPPLQAFQNQVDARLSGAAPLGLGANFNEPAQYNLGAEAAVFRGADGTSTTSVVPTKPGVVLQFFRKNASSIGIQSGFYQTAVLNVDTDFYGFYQYGKFSANLTASSGRLYNNHGIRAYLSIDPSNIGTNIVIGYGAWIQAIKSVSGARAVGMQVEGNNNSGVDDLTDPSFGVQSSIGIAFSSNGNAHASTHMFLEGPTPQSAAYTGMYVQRDSVVRHVIDARTNVFHLSGTITATNGSPTITGVGTKFLTEILAGDHVLIDGIFCKVLSTPVSETSATLSANFIGTTGAYTSVVKTVVFARLSAMSPITATDAITGAADYRLIELTSTNTVSIDADAKGTVLGGTLAIGRAAPLSTTSVHVVGPNNPSGIPSGVGVITIESNTALAADVGGSIAFRGSHTAGGSAGFGGIKAGKTNATDGNLDTYMAFYTRSHAGGILERVRIDAAGQLQNPSYVSQLTAWAISAAGAADFRRIYSDEIHAKSFITDLEQALAGGQIISKSVAELAADFTLPAAGGAGTLVITDLPSASGMAVFESGDIVRLRQFSRAVGVLTVGDAWGVVTGFVNNGNGTQNWTFTRSTGARAGTATGTISGKTLALDYGTTGNGIHEVNAIDGAYGINSPYSQIVTWTTHPHDGQIVRTRTGNLVGITGATEYGLYAGDGGVAAANKFVRVSDVNFEIHNVGLQIFDSTTRVIELNQAGPYFALGNPMPTSFLDPSTEGVWMGKVSGSNYSFRVGITNGAGALTAGMKWDAATDTLTVIGTVTATAGAIGGWSITSTDIRNTAANVMLRGAGNLAFGTTPPTSASAGTGLFGDSTGWTGLLSNVVQAKFDASNGAITFGAGAGTLNASGLSITNGSSAANTIKFLTGSETTARFLSVWASNISSTEVRSEIPTGGNTSGHALMLLSSRGNVGGGADLQLFTYGSTHATKPNKQYAMMTADGFSIGPASAVDPAAMLDVRGSAIFTGTLTAGSGPTTLTSATGKLLLAAVDVSVSSSGQVLTSTGTGTAPTWQTPSGGGANTALSNLASVAINENLLPATAGAVNVGSAAKPFGHLFLAENGVINWNDGDTVLSHFEHQLTVSGARVLIPSAPPALAGLGLLMLGAGPFDGSTSGFFTGLAAGTHLAVNAASGSTADLVHLQVAGVPKFKIGANGSSLFQNLVRVQGALDVPAGATGAGFEMFAAAAGHSVFQSFNRTTSALAPLHLYSSTILISNAVGTPTAFAILDLQSTTSAFMPPRMTTTQRDAMTAADGMHIYNTTLGAAQYRKAGAWVSY